jgi:hypothetical protein
MSSPQAKPENMLLNLVCNIVVPTVVLTNLSAEKRLGPLWALIVAIAFPVAYGVYDLATRKKTNVLSILGFISVLVSGCLALGKVGGLGFAVKDAVLPLVFGAAVLLTLRTKSPLVRTMFFNESIMDVARVEAALDERNQRENLNHSLRRASIGLALTFLAVAPVNFALALYILKSPPGTPEFNAELGKMHWVGPLVITIPSMVMIMTVFWKLVARLSELTGLTTDEIFRTEKK